MKQMTEWFHEIGDESLTLPPVLHFQSYVRNENHFGIMIRTPRPRLSTTLQ